MNDTTSKGGGQIATPLSEDEVIRMKLKATIRSNETLGEIAIESMVEFIKQYGIQERIDGLDMVSWRYGIFRDTTLGKPVDTKAVSLKDIAKYKAELTALKTKQEVAN